MNLLAKYSGVAILVAVYLLYLLIVHWVLLGATYSILRKFLSRKYASILLGLANLVSGSLVVLLGLAWTLPEALAAVWSRFGWNSHAGTEVGLFVLFGLLYLLCMGLGSSILVLLAYLVAIAGMFGVSKAEQDKERDEISLVSRAVFWVAVAVVLTQVAAVILSLR